MPTHRSEFRILRISSNRSCFLFRFGQPPISRGAADKKGSSNRLPLQWLCYCQLQTFRQRMRELGYIEGQNVLSRNRLCRRQV